MRAINAAFSCCVLLWICVAIFWSSATCVLFRDTLPIAFDNAIKRFLAEAEYGSLFNVFNALLSSWQMSRPPCGTGLPFSRWTSASTRDSAAVVVFLWGANAPSMTVVKSCINRFSVVGCCGAVVWGVGGNVTGVRPLKLSCGCPRFPQPIASSIWVPIICVARASNRRARLVPSLSRCPVFNSLRGGGLGSPPGFIGSRIPATCCVTCGVLGTEPLCSEIAGNRGGALITGGAMLSIIASWVVVILAVDKVGKSLTASSNADWA